MKDNCFSTRYVGKTFINQYGVDCSALDFIIYPDTFSDSVVVIKKLDGINNHMSDHYPILANINCSYSTTNNIKACKQEKTSLE